MLTVRPCCSQKPSRVLNDVIDLHEIRDLDRKEESDGCQFPAISTCDGVCYLVDVELEKGKGEEAALASYS
mgnify:CR=1 FL=1